MCYEKVLNLILCPRRNILKYSLIFRIQKGFVLPFDILQEDYRHHNLQGNERERVRE